MDALEGHAKESQRRRVIAYVNEYACFFCESHMQNEQFNSDRQAVDRFGSKVFLFWFFFGYCQFIRLCHSLISQDGTGTVTLDCGEM